jgi:starch phosphorylase
LRVDEKFVVTANVFLNDIDPELIDLEVFYGPVGAVNEIEDSSTVRMTLDKNKGNGNYSYFAEINCEYSGRYGFTVRAVPHEKLWKDSIPGLITWAEI